MLIWFDTYYTFLVELNAITIHKKCQPSHDPSQLLIHWGGGGGGGER